jgi:hypothetical protein
VRVSARGEPGAVKGNMGGSISVFRPRFRREVRVALAARDRQRRSLGMRDNWVFVVAEQIVFGVSWEPWLALYV